MATALVTQIAYAVQSLFDPAGTAGRLIDLGKLANYGLLTSFTPAHLFTTGVNGAWYDPSDYGTTGTGGVGTLFQNAAGTTPVTAVEQPVGLMLDKSKGLVLGPELVANGDFSSSSNWTRVGTGGTASISGGVASVTNAAGSFEVIGYSQNIPVVSGKTYFVTATYTKSSGNGFARLSFGPVTTFSGTATSGVLSGYVTSSASTFTLQAINPGNGSEAITVTFDNISVRELPGNHAFNPTTVGTANFPVLSARYNLLTKSEQFDDAVWTKGGATIASTGYTDPLNGSTARLMLETTTTASHITFQAPSTVSAGSYRFVVYLKPSGRDYASIKFANTGAGGATTNQWAAADFDFVNLSYVTATGAGGQFTNVSASITAVGSWFLCVINVTSSGTWSNVGIQTTTSASPTHGNYGDVSFSGDSSKGIYIWGADLRVANDTLGQPAYQRVNTSTDYDTVGFKPYLRFNGTNQWLQTNSIDFSYGDKMFISAGVRKLSDAAAGVVVELASAQSVTGSISLVSREYAVGDYGIDLRGTSGYTWQNYTGFTTPITSVLSALYDQAGTTIAQELLLRANGVSATTGASSGGPNGNTVMANAPLYLGARAGTSTWFNGRLYGMVVAGKQASAAEITSTETYLNGKTAAYTA